MRKIFAAIGAFVGVAILVTLVVAATKPDTFSVKRTASIQAPPEKIFPLIDNFHRWGVWSPYEKMDPDMKRAYSGAESGPGAVYEWESNGKAGAGRMEIVESTPSSKVTLKLDSTKPFAAHNLVDFTLNPEGDFTLVTWDMHGPNLYLGKIMQIFFDMDRMIGADFETGLANIKAIAEK